jgi:hypothetical protein
MLRTNPKRVCILLLVVTTLVVVDAPNSMAEQNTGEGIITGFAIIGTVVNLPLALANRQLVEQGQGSVALGTFGVLVGAPTFMMGAMMGFAALKDDSVGSQYVLVGFGLASVGLLSAIAGGNSVAAAHKPAPEAAQPQVTLSPVVIAGDGHKTETGIQLQVTF